MSGTSLSEHERMAGGLQGLLIGDALGVPYEFHRAIDLPRLDVRTAVGAMASRRAPLVRRKMYPANTDSRGPLPLKSRRDAG